MRLSFIAIVEKVGVEKPTDFEFKVFGTDIIEARKDLERNNWRVISIKPYMIKL